MKAQKILIVEDNPANMVLAVYLLKTEGYEVIQAEMAEKGIDLAKKELPDLILMDIGLPGMDGLEATRILRKDPKFKDIPIVAMTSHAMKGDEAKILNAGCSGHISKPINTREFAKQVGRYLEESKEE